MSQSRMTLRVAAYATACLVATSLLMGGYYAYQQQPQALAETGEVSTESASHPAIKLSEKALKNMGIGLKTAGPAALETTLSLPGQIAVDEHRLKAVTSRFGGVIMHMQKHVGQKVTQGELLAVLESRELADLKLEYLQQQSQQQQSSRQLQQQRQIRDGVQRLLQLLQQKASFERIQKEVVQLKVGTPKATLLNDYTRLKNAAEILRRETQLYRDQLSSEHEFLQAKQNYEAAQASYMGALEEIARTQDNQLYDAQSAHNLAQQSNSAAASKLTGMGIPIEQLSHTATALNRYEIYAPMSGTLIEKNVTEGDTVTAESVLYKIADLSAVWAETQIYESDIPRVKVGSPVTIFAENQAHQAPGRLEHLKPFVNEETRTAEAHAEIPNPKGIWFPGMFITLKVQQQKKFAPLAVELKALQTLHQQTGIFVESPEGFVFRPLTLGLQAENAVEVLSGVNAGERYVTDNSFVLKSEFLGQAE